MSARVEIACEHCGKTFLRYRSQVSKQNFCSVDCKNASLHGKPKTGRTGKVIECANCGKVFYATRSRLKQNAAYCSSKCYGAHRKQTSRLPAQCHPRQMVESPCQQCGEIMRLRPSEVGKRKFCSRECHGRWRSEYSRGANNPNPSTSVEVACTQCGKRVLRQQYRVKRATHFFCCAACHGAWKAGRSSGRRKRIEVPCAQCGKIMQRTPSSLTKTRTGNHYCSRACMAEWVSANLVGDKRYNYTGSDRGRNDWYRDGGRDWVRACKKRDKYQCCLCGKQHDKHTRWLHVHHILPYAEYESVRLELENGATLCEECHMWLHSNEGIARREAWQHKALDALRHLLNAQAA